MIFVVLGTHELPFTRLLKAVDQLVEAGTITEQVVAQIGHTKHHSNHMQMHKFLTYDQMDQYYNQADLIITHAGTGSVLTGLKKGKIVIAAPRLKKYGEHNDDHQLQLAEVFEQKNHILVWHETERLDRVIQESRTFQPKPFQSGKNKLFSILDSFIQHK
ncbi:hypothetical protein Pryu01_00851 [Paraliobacillus ryukyuensis]|uniref:UDP-N-acetylglucosamine transferase subunit ALG13 n=1 Tax=Paraliobacillus ryukyuensis TaxID=200904 RepID=A0A366EEX7_9BACI|nr:PssE/Cps14G family polysaccharide biosynthesis glycosyltransferase [Paraliobacillus ryukyuensis]RBP00576.1 UDP-N-acetylglucosamine transferase subunit ALG13 [Paraliobacillus ryukyuensis]